MIHNLKALVVVLVIACAVFWLAAPLLRRFMAPEDLRRRAGLWFTLTIAGFASPNFWLFLALAAPLLVWAARRDPNPGALALLLLHVIPPLKVELPAVLINRLFEMTNFRLLALLVLVPAALRLAAEAAQRKSATEALPLRIADAFVIGFGVLQLALLVPYESFTHTMRRAFLYGLDVGLYYYVFSRLATHARRLDDALACLCLGVAPMAAIAVFESARGWLLYQGIGLQWGVPNEFAYLLRGDDLRAQAAAGHALAFGYVCAMAFGAWLFLQRHASPRGLALLASLTLLAGLAASISRGPWVVTAIVFVVFLVLAPQPAAQKARRAGFVVLAGAAVLLSPWGDTIIDRLPFVGSVDAANVDYRQRLAEVSWQLVWRNPFLGDPFVLYQMEELRQGQGIIDLVNSYAAIALFYGFIGLALMLGAFVAATLWVLRDARHWSARDPERAARSAALAACMVGTLFMLAVGSFGTSLALLFWVFSGLGAGWAARNRFVEHRHPVSSGARAAAGVAWRPAAR